MSKADNVIELARANGATLDETGGVQLPKLSPKQKKELLGAEIGTAFDMYLNPNVRCLFRWRCIRDRRMASP